MLGAAFLKLVSGSIGDVVVLMSRSAAHRHYTLADIEWLILPPVMLGQFYVAEAQDEANGFRAPIALITWAKVSPEVDARLTARLPTHKALIQRRMATSFSDAR
jgi:cytolysin-activating lysine-acyltransferase